MAAQPRLNRDFERRAYWHATMPALPDRSGRDLPDVVDVAIVGGGYTGIAAARKLALQGARAIVLEAETLGFGASTRNGGIAHPGFKWGPEALTKRYGAELARAMYRESVLATDMVAGLIRDQQIDAELRWNGFLELAWGPGHAAAFPAEAAALADFGTPARAIERSELHAEIGTDAYHGGLAVDGGGVLHPGKWFAGLVGLAERAGAELHEGIRVRGVRRQADGRFVVETHRGALLAKDVLIATNGYTDGVAPAVRRRVIPIGSYIIATDPLPADLAHELSPTGRAYFDTRNFLSYWHVSADRRMIFGGRVSFFPTSVDRTARLLYRRMLEIHPQLAGTRVAYSWGGKVAITMDRMPHIGRTGGVMYAVGYSGTGVVLSTYLGTRAAEWLGGGAAPALAATRFPLVPAPYEGRPWFLPVVGEWFRSRDRLAARVRPAEAGEGPGSEPGGESS
ncbi:MAG TPA: FAD-binding oxidoreductase [Candidatus Acidoferrales bacterium]|nr:FAD-binding oxidoreductase [Candidatus Acidoferrales bacterium]